MPERIQLRRTKGWRKPEGAVYVGRPTKWGNPFKVGDTVEQRWRIGGSPESILVRDRDHAVVLFKRWLDADWYGPKTIHRTIDELRGKDLACWCPLGAPCHADVLLKVANR